MSPKQKIDLDKLEPKSLVETIDVYGFCCTKDELNEFIHNEALDFQEELLGITHLWYYEGQLVGFVTLSTADIRKEMMDFEDRPRIGKDHYPALQIGQLAVDEKFEGNGIGGFICRWVMGKALDLSKSVGCRFIILNAKRDVISFYKKNGFKMLKRQDKRREPIMFLDIKREYQTESS